LKYVILGIALIFLLIGNVEASKIDEFMNCYDKISSTIGLTKNDSNYLPMRTAIWDTCVGLIEQK
jgi:hypothetical protein